MKHYSGLDELLQADRAAHDSVREQIASRGGGVSSLASLQDYAENLTRGDG